MIRRLLGIVSLLSLAACPSPSSYGTPRTVEPGLVSHTISMEVLGVSGSRGGDATPVVPSYQARIGLWKRLDLGIRAASFTSAVLDLKWNFVRSKYFDLAADPGSQWFYDRANEVHYFYLNAPLMLGFNVRYDLTVVVIPAFVIQATTQGTIPNPPLGSEITRLLGGTAPIVRGGIGLNWRMFRDFAVQPEITIQRQIGGFDGWIVNGGFGVSFLHLPKFIDFNDEEDPSSN